MTIFKAQAVTPRFKPLLDLPMHRMPFTFGIALAIFLMLLAISSPVEAAIENDPLERMNRTTHSFNRTVDKFLLKPLAVTYKQLTPDIVKTGVNNFFNNLDDVRVTFNDLLQFKLEQAAADFTRLAINSTLGIGGIIDVAEPAFNLDKNHQDFGKTLAHYGVGSGPYIVLPLLGPSTVRDAFGLGFDSLVDPIPAVDHVESRNSLLAGKTVDFRARILHFDDLIIGDDYLFIRGIYLQHREYQINGGYVEVAFEEF